MARDLVRRFGYIDFTSEQIEYLKYGRGVDTTRMTERLGFDPEYTTRADVRRVPAARTPWVACCRGTLRGASMTMPGDHDRRCGAMSDAQVIPLNPEREPDDAVTVTSPASGSWPVRCASCGGASRASTRSTTSGSTAS